MPRRPTGASTGAPTGGSPGVLETVEMAKRENISVSFTPQQAEFLARCVESGRDQSTSEVVREGLRLLQDRHARRHAELGRARELVREGARDLDREAVVDGETFFLPRVGRGARLARGCKTPKG